jgi:hypothetical protein
MITGAQVDTARYEHQFIVACVGREEVFREEKEKLPHRLASH